MNYYQRVRCLFDAEYAKVWDMEEDFQIFKQAYEMGQKIKVIEDKEWEQRKDEINRLYKDTIDKW